MNKEKHVNEGDDQVKIPFIKHETPTDDDLSDDEKRQLDQFRDELNREIGKITLNAKKAPGDKGNALFIETAEKILKKYLKESKT